MDISVFCRATVRNGAVLGLALWAGLAAAATEIDSPVSAVVNPTPAVAVPIEAENLIELYQSVPGLRIIDTRLQEDHALGHIERSHNLAAIDVNCGSLTHLTENRDTAMVFYCNGGDAGSSVQALHVAASCGYRRLFWLRGGFIEWQDKDYPFVFE